MMRKYKDRIWWHWLKGHTDRKGPLHMVHNACDRIAGVLTEQEEEPIRTFVAWDWDMVVVDEKGVRIEGDVRMIVRKRVMELMWQDGEHVDSRTEKNMEEQDPLARKVMGKLMRSRGSTHAKKEWIDAMRGRWGLMDSGWYEDETCRLCSDCPTCAHRSYKKWDGKVDVQSA